MVPPCRPSVSWLKMYTTQAFALSKKKHLLITGQKRIGKSTLLKEVLPTVAPSLVSGLILDENGRPKRVYLRQPTGGFCFIIGHRGEHGMRPNPSVLNSIGVRCVQQLLQGNSDVVGIDEIGFLEQSSPPYQSALLSVFRQRSVIAAVRKDSYPFLDQLFSDPDSFVLDLDHVAQN